LYNTVYKYLYWWFLFGFKDKNNKRRFFYSSKSAPFLMQYDIILLQVKIYIFFLNFVWTIAVILELLSSVCLAKKTVSNEISYYCFCLVSLWIELLLFNMKTTVFPRPTFMKWLLCWVNNNTKIYLSFWKERMKTSRNSWKMSGCDMKVHSLISQTFVEAFNETSLLFGLFAFTTKKIASLY
jgi:hypothetical protein